ncbi:MAG: PIN domain-containing protein [Melioribacteraceae bacterium]
MNSYYEEVSKKYFKRGIIIDTNILLLYIVGVFDINRIQNFKRTKQFIVQDFQLLFEYLSKYDKILTTPYILTEVNSFLNQIDFQSKDEIFNSFSTIINNINEQNYNSTNLCMNNDFKKFGLTDISIYELSKSPFIVLTDDLKLSNYLANKNIDVINFNHIRPLNW